MANLKFVAQTKEQALTADTELTMLTIRAPENQRVKILGWGVYFDATNTTILETPVDTTTKEAVEVELASGTDSGIQTDTLGSPNLKGSCTSMSGTGTINSVAKTTTTTEPVKLNILDIAEVDPTEGGYNVMYDEINIPVIAGDDYICITCKSPNAVNCRVKLICEE